MSFHGLPQAYFDAGDPYYCHCQKTARLLAESLKLTAQDYTVTFQSRLGVKAWLKPYTDESLKALPAQGIRHVQVVCPGFSADCLETLEEVAMENRDHLPGGGRRVLPVHPLPQRRRGAHPLPARLDRAAPPGLGAGHRR
jgi:ferrochelatase